jgi:hypothetical protein
VARAGEGEHRGHDALPLQPCRELVEAPPFFAQQVLGGHRAILQRQLRGVGGAHAHLVEPPAHREARRVALDQEHRDAGVAAL